MAKKIRTKPKPEPPPPVLSLPELIEQHIEGTLPAGQLVFKYERPDGSEGMIHRDELYREAVIGRIYSVMHQDRLIGARTAPEDPMHGVDKTNWEKNRKGR